MSLYAVQMPNGELIVETVATNRRDCWGKGFGFVSFYLGKQWEGRYWKRWAPSLRSARNLGYKIIQVTITPVLDTTHREER